MQTYPNKTKKESLMKTIINIKNKKEKTSISISSFFVFYLVAEKNITPTPQGQPPKQRK
jgi:hypothetical protein